MPVLQDLSLLIDDPVVETSLLGQLDVPNCSSLHVWDTTPLADVLDPVFPSLHALTIDYCSSWKFPGTFPDTLAKCTRLRSCTITFSSDLFFVALEPIVLPELVELSLEWPFSFRALFSISCSSRPKATGITTFTSLAQFDPSATHNFRIAGSRTIRHRTQAPHYNGV